MYNLIEMHGWMSKYRKLLLSVCGNLFVYHMRRHLTTQIFNLGFSLTRGIKTKVDAYISFGRLVRLDTCQVFIETHAPRPEHVLLIFQCAKCKRLTATAIWLQFDPRGPCLLWGGVHESLIMNQSFFFFSFFNKQIADYPRLHNPLGRSLIKMTWPG